MAAPFVAGAAALLMQADPRLKSPAEVARILKDMATAGALVGLDSHSPNKMLYTADIVRKEPKENKVIQDLAELLNQRAQQQTPALTDGASEEGENNTVLSPPEGEQERHGADASESIDRWMLHLFSPC